MALTFCRIFKFGNFNVAINNLCVRPISHSPACNSDRVPESAIPKPVDIEVHGAIEQQDNGAIYDKKPFRLTLEKGKTYSWCLCGKSKSQPLCDGTHKLVQLKVKLRPIRFQVEETKEYWLCNCKQTIHRPFCDGTHKREDIQTAIK